MSEAGIVWVGPSPEAIEQFGVKHVARTLAQKANVPIVPGTKGLVDDEEAAVKAAQEIGFPVMLKATGGGGGMGLVTCNIVEDVREGFQMVQSRGKTLFKNSGVFIEAFYPASHHIEVQVFGNGQGNAIHFGERGSTCFHSWFIVMLTAHLRRVFHSKTPSEGDRRVSQSVCREASRPKTKAGRCGCATGRVHPIWIRRNNRVSRR